MFHLNESLLDRGMRLVLGLVLVGVTVTVLTGIVGFCPLYTVLGITTRRSGKRELHPAP